METLESVSLIVIFAVLIVSSLAYLVLNIRCIRVLGCNILIVASVLFLAVYFYLTVIVPLPEYCIKSQSDFLFSNGQPKNYPKLDDVVGEMLRGQGVNCTDGSLVLLDVNSTNFNVLLLCSYESAGKESTAVFHFKRNIFGDLKPEAPIFLENGPVHFALNDGLFGLYLVEAGLAGSDDSRLSDLRMVEGFEFNKTQAKNAYLWVEFMSQSFSSYLIYFAGLYLDLSISANARQRKDKMPPERAYVKWRPGDKVFSITKNPVEDEDDI